MDQVAQIREKIDIASFISEFIPLKKMGRNFKANCPFHNEKTPSFVVSPERQIWHCFGCFPPGELIKTPFGYHPVERIVNDEFVISGKGQYQKVLATHKRNYKGDLITITTRKIRRKVNLTGDHLVLTVRPHAKHENKFKYFSKRQRSYLRYLPTNPNYYYNKTEKWFPIQEIEARNLNPGDNLLFPINERISRVKNIDLNKYITKKSRLGPQPPSLPIVNINNDFLRLLGYYVAEGSSHRAYIRFSLGNHEKEFANEIVKIIKKTFKINATIHSRKNGDKTGLEITACHAHLASVFENLCGVHAENKHIPFLFQELPFKQQQVLIDAIHRGDGTTFKANKSKKLHKSITTVSKVLSEQIVDFLLRLGFFPSLHIKKEKTDRNNVHHKEAYTIFWSEEASSKYNLIYKTRDGLKYWLLPIETIVNSSYRGPVHNLTIEQDHSYVASHFSVSNCGKGGDAFTFLMEYEHLEFVEALRTLAKRVGVELRETYDSKIYSKKEKIYDLNKVAAKFYNYILTKHETGKEALNYLTEERKITPALIETYQLGFSPSSASSLAAYLINKKSYKKQDLYEAGLSFERGGKILDFFKNRIIFPLLDHRDNVVGFSGRVLSDSQATSKYINTKETEAYHKGDMFFGLSAAKEEIKKQDQAIIVEGEFDVITCFKEGIRNVVAVKGTALTENQVSLLARFTKKVTLCLDQDEAGLEAMKRSLSILEKKGLITTIVIPNGKDPDEALKKDPYEFKKAIKNEKPIYDFLLEKTLSDVGKKDVLSKKKIADILLPFISQISNEVIKEHYLKLLSREIDTTYESILKEVGKITSGDKKDSTTYLPKEKKSRREALEEYFLAVVVQSPNTKEVLNKGLKRLKDYKFENKSYEKIIEKLKTYFENIEKFNDKKFASGLPNELLKSFDTCFLLPLPKFESNENFSDEIEDVGVELLTLFIKERIRSISDEIKLKKNEGEAKVLKQELVKLIANLPKFAKS